MPGNSLLPRDNLAPKKWAEFHLSAVAPTPEAFRVFLMNAGVDPDQSRYSPNELKLLIVKAILQLQDEFYGLSTQILPMGSIDLFIRAMNSGQTLREATTILHRMSRKFLNSEWLSLKPHGDDYIFELKVEATDDERAGAVEVGGIITMAYAMQAFVGKEFGVETLYSKSKLWTSFIKYSHDLKCPVQHADFTGFVLKAEMLDLPRRTTMETNAFANAIRWSLFADQRATSLKTDGRLRGEAEKFLQEIEARARGRKVAESQAGHIACEPDAYSLRDLKRGIRVAVAIGLISTTDKTMSEIADDLEFSDDRAFSRFFRGTVGCTPLEYRQLHRSEVVGGNRDIFGGLLDTVQQLV